MSAFNYLFSQIWIAPMFLNFCYCEYLPALNFSLIVFFFFQARFQEMCLLGYFISLLPKLCQSTTLLTIFLIKYVKSDYHFWPI